MRKTHFFRLSTPRTSWLRSGILTMWKSCGKSHVVRTTERNMRKRRTLSLTSP
jgi:hypothetical protein